MAAAVAEVGWEGFESRIAVATHDFGQEPTSRRLAFGGLERITGTTWRFEKIEVRALPAPPAP